MLKVLVIYLEDSLAICILKLLILSDALGLIQLIIFFIA